MTVTKQQARDRFVLLPPVLQDAVFSDSNAEKISAINEQFKVPEDAQEIVASRTGWVLLGFLPQENLAEELVSGAGMDASTAKSIASALNEKIFQPLQSAINSISAPAPTPSGNTGAPKVIQDIASAKSAVPVPTPNTQTSGSTPIPLTNLSSKGWSRMSSADLPPVPSAIKKPAPFPSAPVPVPTPSASFVPRTIGGVPIPGRPVTPTPAPAPAPAPVMIQRGEIFAAPARNADFHLERKMGAQMDLEGARIQPKAKPAMIEFGQAKPAPTPSTPGTPPASWRAGAYSGFATSLPSVPIAKEGGRSVTEITTTLQSPKIPAMPQPPMPPKPPAAAMGQTPMTPRPPQTPPPSPPTPPSPPKPPTPKVIVQNFTE